MISARQLAVLWIGIILALVATFGWCLLILARG
jgi:hypothetical protein